MESLVPLILALIAVAAVLYLSYVFSRYMAVGAAKINKSKYIKVVDRIVLGQDRMIMIAMIGEKYYLIGSTSQSIQILKELEEEDLQEGLASQGRWEGKTFQSTFKAMLSRRGKDE